MEEVTRTLFYNLANPCFSKNFIVIDKLREGTYILFQNRIWSMLISVKEVFEGSPNRNAHLLIDIEKSEGCATLSRPKGAYLYGADKQTKDGKDFLYHSPFLKVGQGITLSENVSDASKRGQVLFYELGAMFVVDFSLRC